MRCYDTRRSRWGQVEPATDPVAATGRWTHGDCDHRCESGEHWEVEIDGTPRPVADLWERQIVAFVPGPTVLIHREGKFLAFSPGSAQEVDANELKELLGKTPGSRVAGGGRFVFDEAGALIDAQDPQRFWPSVVKPVGRDVWGDWGCEGQPLVSPDQRRAACTAQLVGEAEKAPLHQTRPHRQLWIFDLE
jgi:hypothetical protein